MGASFNPHPPPGVQLQATARHEERSKERAGEREAELPESGFVVIVLVCEVFFYLLSILRCSSVSEHLQQAN